jgi:hypothetical protein
MVSTLSIAGALGCIVGATLVFAYQIFAFLKTGEWLPLSLVSALSWAGVSWAASPTEWQGLHRLLGWAPLSLSMYFGSALPILLANWFESKQ